MYNSIMSPPVIVWTTVIAVRTILTLKECSPLDDVSPSPRELLRNFT